MKAIHGVIFVLSTIMLAIADPKDGALSFVPLAMGGTAATTYLFFLKSSARPPQ